MQVKDSLAVIDADLSGRLRDRQRLGGSKKLRVEPPRPPASRSPLPRRRSLPRTARATAPPLKPPRGR